MAETGSLKKPHRTLARLVLSAASVLALLAPDTADAQQRAMLEKSSSYALDNIFRAFRVPVRDSNGRVKYQDVTVTLSISSTGVISSTASVTATASPNVTYLVVRPGTYEAVDGTICTVTNITLSNGRIQSTFTCTRNSVQIEFAVTTGPVAAGHPFLTALKNIGIDTLPEVGTKTWGMVSASNGNNNINSCGGFYTNGQTQAVGAVTDSNVVSVSLYSRTAFQCGVNLTRQ